MPLLVNVFVLTLVWMFVNCNDQRDKLFFLQKSSGDETETLLVVTWKQGMDDISAGCEIFNDKDLINEVLKSSGEAHIRTLSESEMENLLGDCTEFSFRRRRRESDQEPPSSLTEEDVNGIPRELRRRSNRRGSSANSGKEGRDASMVNDSDNQNAVRRTTEAPTTTPGYDGWPVIFPGTKWCGAGDIAKNYDDLGLHQDTDRCCRAHDLCNDTLAPGETRNNLTNKSSFTKLSCTCDHAFYDCLDRVNSVTSNTIGNMYFNLLKRGCYEKDYPSTKKCKKYRTFLKIKCLEYEKDMTAKPVYQWVAARKYKKIPFPGPLTVTLPF
uniref:Phospholipase A2 n=1 Tax=Cupiennius salei TaxID=6928 RepID=T1E1S9_CUPSA